MGNKKIVMLNVDSNFFDNIFEKERKKTEKELGIRFGQRTFTKYLAMKNVEFKFPDIIKNGNKRVKKNKRK